MPEGNRLPKNFKPVHGNLTYWVQWTSDVQELHYDENNLLEALGLIYGSQNHTCLLTIKDKDGNVLDQYVISRRTRESVLG